jgi:hypothetical protein
MHKLLKMYLKPLLIRLNKVIKNKINKITTQLLNIKKTLSNSESIKRLSLAKDGKILIIGKTLGSILLFEITIEIISQVHKKTNKCFNNFIIFLVRLATN